MADTKNEAGKSSPADKQMGTDAGAGGKVSAGSSVGNIGQSPMPHAQEGAKPAQGSSGAASAAGGSQAADKSKGQSSQQSEQGGSMTGKAQQTAGQARQKAGEAYEGASEWARDTYERASDWTSDAYERQRRRMGGMRGRSGRAFSGAREGVQSYVAENPMVVGLVGLAAGLLLGALLPRTRREDEVFGEWADEVRHQGLRYAREAAHRGREYMEEGFGGEDAQFSRNESETRPEGPDVNRH